MAHAIGFHPQGHIQCGGRHILEVVGTVAVGRTVHIGGADLFEGLKILALIVLGTIEHQVFKQVGEATAARRLILGTYVVPHVDGNNRCLAVGVHNDPQAIGQGELLIRNLDGGLGDGLGRGLRRGIGNGRGQGGDTQTGDHRQGEATQTGSMIHYSSTLNLENASGCLPIGRHADLTISEGL